MYFVCKQKYTMLLSNTPRCNNMFLILFIMMQNSKLISFPLLLLPSINCFIFLFYFTRVFGMKFHCSKNNIKINLIITQ